LVALSLDETPQVELIFHKVEPPIPRTAVGNCSLLQRGNF
jgi:hypothetical protein